MEYYIKKKTYSLLKCHVILNKAQTQGFFFVPHAFYWKPLQTRCKNLAKKGYLRKGKSQRVDGKYGTYYYPTDATSEAIPQYKITDT